MLNTAVKAARRAASILQRATLNLEALRIHPHSAISEADYAAEATIAQTILEAYPRHSILSEESGLKGENTEYTWLIDPIDGSVNFVHGHPQYAISIALLYKEQVQQAVVYDPNRNDLFTASRGTGAFLNNRRIRVAKRSTLDECTLATGFDKHNPVHINAHLDSCKTFLTKGASLRQEGTISLDLCNVACARLDGVWTYGAKNWSLAAGSLMLQEAGAIVTDINGEQTWLETGDMVAANPKILAQLLHMIKGISKNLSF